MFRFTTLKPVIRDGERAYLIKPVVANDSHSKLLRKLKMVRMTCKRGRVCTEVLCKCHPEKANL